MSWETFLAMLNLRLLMGIQVEMFDIGCVKGSETENRVHVFKCRFGNGEHIVDIYKFHGN